jgi:hypothetical protein
VGVRNDVAVFARLDGDTGERDRLCRFRRPRDLAWRETPIIILNSDAPRFAAEPSSRGLWPALTSTTKKPARMNGRAIPNSG